jgi:hypothetical protein
MKLFFGIESVGHSFASVAPHFIFLRDVWIRTQQAGACQLSHPSPFLATHLSKITRKCGKVKDRQKEMRLKDERKRGKKEHKKAEKLKKSHK